LQKQTSLLLADNARSVERPVRAFETRASDELGQPARDRVGHLLHLATPPIEKRVLLSVRGSTNRMDGPWETARDSVEQLP
jgi:hypothetical protein